MRVNKTSGLDGSMFHHFPLKHDSARLIQHLNIKKTEFGPFSVIECQLLLRSALDASLASLAARYFKFG